MYLSKLQVQKYKSKNCSLWICSCRNFPNILEKCFGSANFIYKSKLLDISLKNKKHIKYLVYPKEDYTSLQALDKSCGISWSRRCGSNYYFFIYCEKFLFHPNLMIINATFKTNKIWRTKILGEIFSVEIFKILGESVSGVQNYI